MVMKIIALTRGMFATVDDEDYERIFNMGKWQASRGNGAWYATITKRVSGKKITILMHRVVMNSSLKERWDHRDRNSLNNCKSNLRVATSQQNNANSSLRKDNTSGLRGVTWHKASKRWMVGVGGVYSGLFENKKDAALEYNRIARLRYGEFAYVNPEGDAELPDDGLPEDMIQDDPVTDDEED